METISVLDASGRALNARVDVDDTRIVLHSRSGGGDKTRNPDYRLALMEILTRLNAAGLKYDVYLDSSASQKLRPELQDRHLLSSDHLMDDVDLAASQIIKKSNEGSQSHGAWRRLLFVVSGSETTKLGTILGGVGAKLPPITAGDLARVDRSHIDAAILEIRQGRERSNRFEAGTKYRLIVGDGGDDLPPKKVFGIALSILLDRPVGPQDFSSGDAIFSVLRSQGFQVVQTVESIPGLHEETKPFVRDDVQPLPMPDEEISAVEGDRRLRTHYYAERSGTLPKLFKAQFKRLNGGLVCERCGNDFVAQYGEDVAEACFDVHHKVPLSEREEAAQTTVGDLQLLCANCHRVTHREMSRRP